MFFKKFGALGCALLLALASLVSFAFTDSAQALGTTLYWCEFSSNSSFNIASNWNTNSDCSSGTQEVPVSSDLLVFDNSHLTSGINITNNISGLDLGSITFQGNGNAGYTISGDAISLDNGITDSGTGGINNAISLNITLTTSQVFSASSGNDLISLSGSINLGSNNLGLTTNSSNNMGIPGLSGTGGLTLNGPGSAAVATYSATTANPSYSGPVTINNDATVQESSGTFNSLGTGLITINSGGSLDLISSSSTGTISNALKLNGSGDGISNFGSIISCLGASSCTSSNSTLTLSGNVILSGNTKVINGAYISGDPAPTNSATFDFTGNISYGGFTLAAYPASNTIVNLPALTASGSGSSTNSNIKAPDTGVGLASKGNDLPLIGSLFIALSLILVAIGMTHSYKRHTSTRN